MGGGVQKSFSRNIPTTHPTHEIRCTIVSIFYLNTFSDNELIFQKKRNLKMPAPPYSGPIDKKIACHMEWDPDCKLWVGNLGEEGNRYVNYIFIF